MIGLWGYAFSTVGVSPCRLQTSADPLQRRWVGVRGQYAKQMRLVKLDPVFEPSSRRFAWDAVKSQ